MNSNNRLFGDKKHGQTALEILQMKIKFVALIDLTLFFVQ